jgi:hypothetical protein
MDDAIDIAEADRQDRLYAIQGLHVGFFIHTQHRPVVGRLR